MLDVGAGSGSDAAWFAAQGHAVFAVEPARGLRDQAVAHHDHPRIQWIDDRLPGLEHIGRTASAWDLIWLSAVWMHIRPADRTRAFRKLANRLRPGGRMIITLRHGDFDDGRTAHPVSSDEVMRRSERRLRAWWERLRQHGEPTRRQFDDEVRSAFPFVLIPSDTGEVFEGLATLRASLQRDQQIPE